MRRFSLLVLLSCVFASVSLSPLPSLKRRLGRKPPQLRPETISKDDSSSSTSLSLSPEAIRLAETLAPKLGVFTSTALYFAPAAAVITAIRNGDIGDLNPIPVCIMSTVSVSWLAYGLSARDPYVALSNIAGCIGSAGYVIGLLPLLTNHKQLRATQAVVWAGVSALLSAWTYLGLSNAPRSVVSSTMGMFGSVLFIILAASPLATIKTVVSSRNSKSILGPLTMAQVVNCALWTMYGFTVRDRFVWGPNVIGLTLGLAQLTLKLLFP